MPKSYTWAEAFAFCRTSRTGGSDDRGKQLNFTYYGERYSFSVVRNTEGKYAFRDGDDNWRVAGYNYRTCS